MDKEISGKLNELSEYLIEGKHLETERLTKELISLKVEPKIILDEALMKGMAVVGQRFRDQQMYVPQVLVAARAMKFSMNVLKPLMVGGQNLSKGKVMLGTVKGDVHDIGKNLVSIMLQGAGYEVIDLGTGVTAEKYFEEYEKNNPDVIGLSALLTTTMVYMKNVVEFLKEKNIKVPIVIGGAPTNKKFADEIGAAGHGRSAYEAVALIDAIIKSGREK